MNKHSNTQKVLKGVSSQTMVTLMLGVVELLSFSIMSRLLTKADFGYYAAITGIVAVFASFSETGIGSAIVQCKDLTKRYVNNAFTLSLIIGFVISFLLFSLSGVIAGSVADDSMIFPLKLMSITLLLHCMTSVFASLMHRRLEFFRMGLIRLFSLIVTTVVAVILAYEGYGYYAIITKAVLESVLTFLLFLYFCKTGFGIMLDKQTSSSIFKFSGWLMASVLFRNLSHQIDKLLMPKLLSIESLGAYNRPKNFIEQISSKLNGIFDIALFPVLSSIQDEKEKLARAFRQSLSIMNMFAMLLTLTFIFNSQLIIRIFFGEKWMNLNTVTIILAFVLIFNIDGRLSDCYLRSLGMTKQQFYFRIFETILNISGVLMGCYWGVVGVAVAIVITNSVAKLLKVVYIANKIEIGCCDTLRIILNSWRFAIILVPICFFAENILPNSLIGNVVMGILFVIVVSLIFFFFPHFVGKDYKASIYTKLIKKIKG